VEIVLLFQAQKLFLSIPVLVSTFRPATEIGCVVKVRGIVIQQTKMAVITGYSILVLRHKPDFGRSRYLLFGIASFVLQLPSMDCLTEINHCPNH